jgi:hypothetical protein
MFYLEIKPPKNPSIYSIEMFPEVGIQQNVSIQLFTVRVVIPCISTCSLTGCSDLRQTCLRGFLVARDLIRQPNANRPRLMVAPRGFV